MSKVLVQATYTQEGVKGLLKDGGTTRRAVVEKLFQSLGGSLEAFYYSFEGTDLFLIGEIPDNTSVAAIMMTVVGSGSVHCRTTPLLSPAEIDAAVKKSPVYRAPGQ